LRAIALIALLSLLIAGILLLLGMLISAVAKKPAWLVKVRGVLRLILVSGGASYSGCLSSARFIMILYFETTNLHRSTRVSSS